MKKLTFYADTPTRIESSSSRLLPILFILLISNSCIYEAPGDRFYRTLWTTDESPLEGLTLEFLCDGWISAQGVEGTIGSYGHYESSQNKALFSELTLENGNEVIFISKAQLIEDRLHLTWFTGNENTEHTTEMRRLTAYD